MNKAEIKQAVLDTLRAYGKPLSLPIPIKKITKGAFKNVRLIPYKTMMDLCGISYEEMLDFAGTADAFTDYSARSDSYIIYYNDIDASRMSSNRYRWNIAHELGHVALGHHKKYKESRIFRNEISKELYEEIEEEANMFAAYILVPHIVISCVADKHHIGISKLCKVSGAAAVRRFDAIQAWSRRNRAEAYDLELLGFFSRYVEKNSYSKSVKDWLDTHRACKKCSSALGRFTNFCEVCGDPIQWHYKLKGDIMEYPGIELDEEDRAIECPVCHNTELYAKGQFCMICGNSLVNLCSEAQEPYSPSCQNTEPLPGNARYCPFCGSESTFLQRGILLRWDGTSEEPDDDVELPF